MKYLVMLVLMVAPVYAAHDWCGQVAPGQGLKHVVDGDLDRMCGYIQAKYTGPTKFTPNVKGTKIWINKQLVKGSIDLVEGGFYYIQIAAPKSEDFTLSWDRPLGIPMTIPPTALYQPGAQVGAPCAQIV